VVAACHESEAAAVARRIETQPGIARLKRLAELEGETFDSKWLRKVCARLEIARGWPVGKTLGLSVTDLAALLDVPKSELESEPDGGGLPEWVSIPDVVAHFHLHHGADAVRKRIERDCRKDDADFREVRDRRQNEPRFLYRREAVLRTLRKADLI